MVNVAVLGYGTVGSGVFEVLRTNKEIISKRAGQEVCVKYVLDLREFPGDPVEEVLTHDFEQIINDPEVDIVTEVMGGLEPAHTFVKRALEAGKSACTSNKAMVAEFGPELMRIAKEKNVNFMFEASCGGGIPIIRALNSSLTGDIVDEITGILNGTTNYMMTKMANEGCAFDAVLKEAQAKGYAEADPTADIEGHDACRKIAILSSLAYGGFIPFTKIPCEGITKITPEDMAYAKAMGRSIKLLGTSKLTEQGVYAMVAPFLVAPENPLYSVNDVFNGIFVHGNMLGDAMFYGSGAGKLPTASAVVGDIVDEARHIGSTCPNNWGDKEIAMMDQKAVAGRFFVRISGNDEAAAKNAFGEDVQIVKAEGITDEIGLITGEMTFGVYEEKAAAVADRILSMIRIKD